MWLPSGQNTFKMVVVFCVCCVIVLAVFSIYTDRSGTEYRKPLGSSRSSQVRSRINSIKERHGIHNNDNNNHLNDDTVSSIDRQDKTDKSSNMSSSIVTSANLTTSDKTKNKTTEEGQGNTTWHKTDKSIDVHNVGGKPAPLSTCLNSRDLPNERITPRKQTTTMEKVNTEVFGDLLQKVKDAADIANKSMPSIIVKRKSIKEAATSIDQTIAEMNVAVDVGDYRLLPGGHWIPLSCKPTGKVAIVVPFRNRFQHLPIFLRHIVPLLKRQELEFSIFISEQRNALAFNRAMLMNVGFVEALNFTEYDCVVFHDVDHLAVNIKNYYGCENMPKHFISGEAMWNWKIIYPALFGGVTGVTRQQFFAINGLPNVYWGWGGEDDEFASRVTAKGFRRTRPEGTIGYFDTAEHKKEQSSPPNDARFCLLNSYKQRMSTDGVSNLAYEPPIIELHPLYTNISVNIQRLPWNPNWKKCEKG